MRLFSLTLLSLLLSACTGLPKGVTPVSNFELQPYLGKWYEIARLDHSFERGLSKVSAEYSLNQDGSVKVINRGYSEQEASWSEAEGKAKFVDASDQGHLKVAFFGPFYGSYVVFELDEDYQYAFVAGPNFDYLWLLARQPEISAELKQRFVQRSAELGFATEQLIWPEH